MMKRFGRNCSEGEERRARKEERGAEFERVGVLVPNECSTVISF